MPNAGTSLVLMGVAFIVLDVGTGSAKSAATPSSSIDRYIEMSGGCSFFETSLLREFHRPDRLPYGKPYVDWTADDYESLRRWSVTCLNSWSRAPGRREIVLEAFDRRLKVYQGNQQALIEQIRRDKLAEEALRRRSEEIADLRSKIESRSAPVTELLILAQSEAISFLANSRAVDFDRLEATIGDGLEVEAKVTQAEIRTCALKSDAHRLRTLGGKVELTTADRNAFSKFKERLRRIRQLSAIRNACAAGIKKAGIPIEVSQIRIYSMSHDDPFLVEFLSGPILRGANISYRGPNWISSSYQITINRLALTFVRRDIGSKGLLTPKMDAQLTANTRLILKQSHFWQRIRGG